jgi:hypothetical protein
LIRRLALATLLWAGLASASPLFDDDETVEISLRGPIGTMFSDTADRREREFAFVLDADEYPAGIRLRGNSRLRVCKFYPLRINLDPADYASTVFAGQDKLKLVTHCRNYDQGEQDMLEEYLAYRIFNAITDFSYRVRLLRIRYVDTDGRLESAASPRYGFVIEPDWHLAERTNSEVAELEGVPKQRYDKNHAALVFVFQFLIGNTDWGLVKADYDEFCCHNIDMVEKDGQVLVIPYDFDVSGIVNARYAFPDPLLRIERVTRRVYLGLCMEREPVEKALRHIKARREEIAASVEQVPGLTERSRDTALSYVGKFFERAEDEDKLLRTFEKRCK